MMSRIGRYFLGALLAFAWSCADVSLPTPERVDSNTNWLMYCATDADCGDLSCHCNVCTSPCEDDCSLLGPNATCVAANGVANLDAVCGDASAEGGVCVAVCASSAECGEGRQCLMGTCIESIWEHAEFEGSDCEGDCSSSAEPHPDPCYLDCRARANAYMQTCLELRGRPYETCIGEASALLGDCAGQCGLPTVVEPDATDEAMPLPGQSPPAETPTHHATPRASCILSMGETMIASPNPPESVSDTDGACLEYCWASGMQPGNICTRGGQIVAIHNLLPGDSACWRACAADAYPGVLDCLEAGNDGDLCQELLNIEVARCGGGC